MRDLIEDEDGAPYPEGVQAIARERARQIIELGYDEAHDEHHTPGNIMTAAANMLTFGDVGLAFHPMYDEAHLGPNAPTRDQLVKSGALIAAAIDRLDATITEETA